MSDARRAADLRLANGEITLEQHSAIVAAISASDSSGGISSPNTGGEGHSAKMESQLTPEQRGEEIGKKIGDWINANWKTLIVVGVIGVFWVLNSNARSRFYNEMYRGYAENGSFSLARSRCFAKYITDKEGPIFLFVSASRANIEKWKRYGSEAIPYCRSGI
jgi:hypothetical protein